jgi:hypothetical protein
VAFNEFRLFDQFLRGAKSGIKPFDMSYLQDHFVFFSYFYQVIRLFEVGGKGFLNQTVDMALQALLRYPVMQLGRHGNAYRVNFIQNFPEIAKTRGIQGRRDSLKAVFIAIAYRYQLAIIDFFVYFGMDTP